MHKNYLMTFSLVEMLYNKFAHKVSKAKYQVLGLEEFSFEDTENSVPCKASGESSWAAGSSKVNMSSLLSSVDQGGASFFRYLKCQWVLWYRVLWDREKVNKLNISLRYFSMGLKGLSGRIYTSEIQWNPNLLPHSQRSSYWKFMFLYYN